MEESKVFISSLEPGAYFDDSLPGAEPDRDRLYMVVGVRTRTVLAENVAGIRRSFSKTHEVRKATIDAFKALKGQAVPATPFSREQRQAASGEASEKAAS